MGQSDGYGEAAQTDHEEIPLDCSSNPLLVWRSVHIIANDIEVSMTIDLCISSSLNQGILKY